MPAFIHAEKIADDILDGDDTATMNSYQQQKADAALESTTGNSYTIKMGRIIIFAVAALLLMVSVVFALFSLFTSFAWVWSGITFSLSFASLATLRILALKDAKVRGKAYRDSHRNESAPQIILSKEANTPEVADIIPQSEEIKKLKSDVIELSSTPHRAPVKTEHQRPIAYAAKSLRYARINDSSVRPQLEGTAGATAMKQREFVEPQFATARKTWNPADVPQPTYLEMEEVEWKLPDPLELPEEEKAQSRTLAEAAEYNQVTTMRTLDEILKRRRA